ncbi:MAG: molybdenum cofactor biosynthesis protein MoaE [Candidatus Competibacteraceae bacterium]
MKIELCTAPFEPTQALAAYQESLTDLRGRYGATVVFIGTMRDFNEGSSIQSMTLEHYPGMTEQQLQQIVTAAQQRGEVLDVLVMHRVGMVYPDDPILLVAVWSAHRAAAFEVCRAIVEGLKAQAPFWKKETLSDGAQRWVEKNTAG